MAYVLIVEDETPLREAYRTILAAHGYEIDTAADGGAALQLTRKREPDVILLDMKLPRMSGLEFLRRLRQDTDGAFKSAVIIFSNQEQEPDIDEAFELGAKKYILKAWASPRNLVKVVDEVLAG
jgi:CheY-like chemotaxis protein